MFPNKYIVNAKDSKYLNVEEIKSCTYDKPNVDIFNKNSFKTNNLLLKFNLDYLIDLFVLHKFDVIPINFDILVQRAVAESKIIFFNGYMNKASILINLN